MAGMNRDKLIGKETSVPQVSQDKGLFGHFCYLDNAHVLSVFRHDYKVVLFLS